MSPKLLPELLGLLPALARDVRGRDNVVCHWEVVRYRARARAVSSLDETEWADSLEAMPVRRLDTGAAGSSSTAGGGASGGGGGGLDVEQAPVTVIFQAFRPSTRPDLIWPAGADAPRAAALEAVGKVLDQWDLDNRQCLRRLLDATLAGAAPPPRPPQPQPQQPQPQQQERPERQERHQLPQARRRCRTADTEEQRRGEVADDPSSLPASEHVSSSADSASPRLDAAPDAPRIVDGGSLSQESGSAWSGTTVGYAAAGADDDVPFQFLEEDPVCRKRGVAAPASTWPNRKWSTLKRTKGPRRFQEEEEDGHAAARRVLSVEDTDDARAAPPASKRASADGTSRDSAADRSGLHDGDHRRG